jgi:hypothetical protein
MPFFNFISGSVVLGHKGTYIESPLFEMDNEIYARHHRNYVRLRHNGQTSKDRVYWKAIDTPASYEFPMGNMTLLPKSIKAVS